MRHLFIIFAALFFSFTISSERQAETLQKESLYEATTLYEKHDGKRMRFSDHKGKVVLLYVWAHWCDATRDNRTWLPKLEKKINNTNFEIITVSMDNDRPSWRTYLKENEWKGTHLMKKDGLDDPLNKVIYVPKDEGGQTTY